MDNLPARDPFAIEDEINPLDRLTRLEAEKHSKRVKADTEEQLEGAGQDNERRALPFIREEYEKNEERARLINSTALFHLKRFKRHRKQYNRFLGVVLRKFIQEEDLSNKYQVWINTTDKGVVVGIKQTNFIGAFKSSGVEKFDLHAAKIFAIRVGNTVSKLEGGVHQTESGIIVPDSVDVKRYAKRT